MDIVKTTLGAFRRSSSAIGLVIIAGFIVMLLSMGYHILAYSPTEFLEKPEAEEYENSIAQVGQMDSWTRTQYYWSNNLRVAGMYVAWTPSYFSFHSLMFATYRVGLDLSYWYQGYGGDIFLAFVASIFVHGILELTGFFIVAAITLRVGWNLWKGLGYMAATEKGKKWSLSWEFSKKGRKKIRKFKGKIIELLVDFLVLASIGAFLIFLAGPIEAYISPWISMTFVFNPLLAALFLAAVGFLYVSISIWGLRKMRKDAKALRKDIEFAFKRKWRPVHLSLLIFAIFSIFAAVLIFA